MKKLLVAFVLSAFAAFAAQNLFADWPDWATPVDYIESTGAQYISTGIAPTDKTVLELDCTLKSTAQQALFSSGTWAQNHFMLVTPNKANFTFYGTGSWIASAAVDHRYFIQVGAGNALVRDLTNGGGGAVALTTAGNSTAITLFNANNNYYARYRLHSCRISDNGTLLRNFIPCVSNGLDTTVAGLYDTVENKFYIRANTKAADFTVGPEKYQADTLDVRISSDLISPAIDPSGTLTGLASGSAKTLTAPATATDELGNTYDCTGCRIYDAAFDPASGQMAPGTEIAGSPFAGTSVSYTHGATMRIAVWQYAVRTTADPDDFSHCVEFTTPNVAEGVDVTQFRNVPVLVRLTDDPTKFSYGKLSDPDGGADIAFFSADGTLLPHEIDNWDRNGTSTVWVKIPELKTGAKFRMYFGCATAAKRVVEKPTVVWGDYQAVWHMDETAEQDGGVWTSDSSGNNLPAKVNNTTTTAVHEKGIAGNSYLGKTAAGAFSSGLIVPDSASLLDLSSFTISGWVRRPTRAWLGSDTPFSSKTSKSAAGGGFAPAQGNMAIQLQLYLTGGNNVGYYDRLMDITFYDWTYFTLSYVSNSVTGGTFNMYVNGSNKYNGARDYAVSNRDLGLGAFSGATSGWNGPLDEMRWIRKTLSSQRIAADYQMVKNANYFDIQGVAHGDDGTLTVTKYIPELGLDIDLPECHQTCISATNGTFTCSATRDRFFTTGDIAYECTGYVFTPKAGEPAYGSGTSFAFEPATMSGGTLQWQFAKAGYRARVHALPPYLAEKARVTVTPDTAANHLFDCYYKENTELTVTLQELEEGAFTRWYGTTAEVATNKTVTYTVAATANNPEFVAEVCGIVSKDDDTRLASDNCARTPSSRYLYLSTTGSDTNDALTAATPLKSIAKAVEIARAGYAADGAQQVVIVDAGEYSGYSIRTVPITEPIVFDGGTNNPAFTGNDAITGEYGATYYYKIAGVRAAFKRLTVKVTGTTTSSKAAGILSVSPGLCESVVMTNLCTGSEFNAAEGCVYLGSGGVISNCLVTQCHSDCPTSVKNTHGTVKMGGGLLVNTRITGCRVGGTAEGQGGGVYMTGGTIRNCLIDNCRAYVQGSGLYVPAGAACTIENCTVVDCGPASGSAADLYGAYLVGASGKAISFVNNIVYGNSGASSTKKDILNIYRNNATYVSLYNNLSDTAFAEDATTSGNVAGDPSFTDRAGGDYTIGRGLARNAGLERTWALAADTKDLAGNARILEDCIDIGCYEYVPSDALAATITVTKPVDFKYGDEVTLTCDAVGGAGGYSYEWYFGDTLVASGTDASTNIAVRTMGVIDVRCVVTDAALAQVSVVQEGAIRLFTAKVYVSKTGSHTIPFDTWATAATNFEDSVSILDATKTCTVTVGPGTYVLKKQIALAQKTAFVSTDGAEATVLRPEPGVSAFSVTGAGTSIDGFTVEGMSGAARAVTVGTTFYMTNVCFRSCTVSGGGSFIWSSGTTSLNTMGLTLNCVTNLGGALFACEEGNTIDTHRYLKVIDCWASSYGIYAVRHGFRSYNGLFLRVRSANQLGYLWCGGDLMQMVNTTFDDCICNGGFASNTASDPFYFYNCVIGRFWTSTAKTTRATVMAGGSRCYSTCLPAVNPGSGQWDAATITADAKLKSGGYLKSNSPCLKAGKTSYCTSRGLTTDLDGKPRFHTVGETTTVDMGCYENDIHGLLLLVK